MANERQFYSCALCGFSGYAEDADTESAWWSYGARLSRIEADVCEHCGKDALRHACPECGGPFLTDVPEAEGGGQ